MNTYRIGRMLSAAVVPALLALLQLSATAGEKSGGEEGFKAIFNGKNLDGWKVQLQGKGDPEKTFAVKGGVIHVSGQPAGYFYTDKSYKNYILRFEWKFANDKPNSNSGLLIHIQEPHKVWPKSIEVQGMQGDHGHIFAIGGASGKFQTNRENQKKAIKLGDWNTTEVTVRGGKVSSKINGLDVSSGEGNLKEGPFGFQSEGTPLYFKNIRIKVLD